MDMQSKKSSIIKAIKQTVDLKIEDFVAWKIAKDTNDPFKVLIATILSQNTTDKAAILAFYDLEKGIGVDPWKLKNTNLDKISKLIRVAGLHFTKAKAIRKLSEIVIEKFGGDIKRVLTKDLETARKELTALPRVGKKTADVLLLMLANKPVLPIDTHISRVALRLGISDRKDYDSVQLSLMEILENENLLEVHLYLIAFGRKICKARKPLCSKCPLNSVCKYYKSRESYTKHETK